ncbi:MAG: cupin [Acidobacteria bacterium]|jgi:quercetin dioxygenase-like cupin family protein|nr:cupin [Acidobacteriota bacterium]MBF85048.1 cupin [Acidobacteriota bacterium]MCH2277774.1 cupin domain-containing protein [Vicinamibacterales bacterium]MEC7769117.1 cupin domain-containing protein [Acidobacteriota bacterium]|tara:strand:+ start:5163 stop:5513 length:351 start_codon:yes stop_codon:yes gene_type:complete
MKAVTWDDIPVELITNSVERRVLWGSKGTFAQLTLADGTHVAKHRHAAEQFTCVIAGAIRLSIDGQEVLLQPGEMLVIPSNAEHEAWAIKDCIVWDFFTERRDDWEEGKNQYLDSK